MAKPAALYKLTTTDSAPRLRQTASECVHSTARLVPNTLRTFPKNARPKNARPKRARPKRARSHRRHRRRHWPANSNNSAGDLYIALMRMPGHPSRIHMRRRAHWAYARWKICARWKIWDVSSALTRSCPRGCEGGCGCGQRLAECNGESSEKLSARSTLYARSRSEMAGETRSSLRNGRP
jgi:hypothetical protein